MTGPSGGASAVRKLIISEILILLLLLASFATFQMLHAQKPEVQERKIESTRLNVDVFVSRPIDFQELLTGFGTARADREVVIAAQVSGEIVDIHPSLKVGQKVVSGQLLTSPDGPSTRRDADLLLKIDPRDFRQRAEQADNSIGEAIAETKRLKLQETNLQRQLAQAKTVLATLKDDYDRARRAESKRVMTKSDLNRALIELQRYEDTIIQLESQAASIPLQISAAEQRLASSKSEKRRAENDLQRTEVYPPFDGTLSEVFVEKGRYVRAGEQLVRLTDPTIVEIPISLGFDDFLQLQSILADGTEPHVSLSENETAPERWKGTLVRSSPEADSRSRTVQVYVEVENNDAGSPLLPGTFVFSRIDGRKFQNVILIPREAMIDGTVFVVDEENIARRQKVKPGRRFQSLVVIESGLSPLDRVVLTNLDIVEDDQEVVVQTETGPADEIGLLRNPTIRVVAEATE